MARRYLGMSAEEWDALEWWQQRVYIDGYREEGLLRSDSEESPAHGRETVTHAGGTTVTEREETKVFSGQAGELAAFGFNERTL